MDYGFDGCLRCGLPAGDQSHNKRQPPPQGWHSFRGQRYLDGLEDGLLFVREKKQRHVWAQTGITIDTIPSFEEQYCTVCGGINWGGKEDAICFGNKDAESAVVAAHNRRGHNMRMKRMDGENEG
jgi:hypothetical protein